MTQPVTRILVVLWPLLVSPVVAIGVGAFAGSSFDGAVNQSSIVSRILGFVIWSVAMVLGAVITGLVLTNRTKRDIVFLVGSTVAGIAVAYLILSRVE